MNIVLNERVWEPTCRALIAALAIRDEDTGEHSRRVQGLVAELGLACKLSADERWLLGMGALLHDVGKIGTPDAVLLKPGRLAPEEFECMREHPVLGERVIRDTALEGADALARIVRHHHEAFDGSGYPDGLVGAATPIEAKLVALADIYDAIGSERPYRAAQPHSKVLAIMDAESGVKIDPELFKIFLGVIERSPFKLD